MSKSIRKHSLLKSIVLHLLPGILVGISYYAIAPVVKSYGFPSVMALILSGLFVLLPLELGFLIYHKRKKGASSIKGIIAYTKSLKNWQYFVYTLMIRKGMYPEVKQKPPFSPGYDVVGVVDQVGNAVTRFREEDKVADMTVIGAYSEFNCLHENRLIHLPDKVDPAEAVSTILSYVTAYQMLHRTTLFRLLAQNKIKPIIAGHYPLEKAAEVHQMIERADVKGKIDFDVQKI